MDIHLFIYLPSPVATAGVPSFFLLLLLSSRVGKEFH